MLSLKFFISNGLLPVCSFFLPVRSVVVQLLKIFGNKKRLQLSILNDTILQPGALFSSNAGSPYRGLPQDDTSFTKKFLGFASPPHDGFADKFSIVTKENLQAVYAAPPPCAFIIHAERPLVKLFFNFFCKLWIYCVV